MGLFSKIKRQLLEVIEWKDDSKDTLVYRYPLNDRDEIMNSSTLIVRPSQVALFVHKGQIADIFVSGTYKLASENIPFLTKLLSLPTGFNSPIKAEIYFINTKQFVGQKWGTQNPVMMRDAEFGNIRLRAFGVYSFKVDDAKKFMEEVFGSNEVYKVDDISEQLKPLLIQGFSDAIAESKISALDLAANYKEFSETILKCSQPEFKGLGLKLASMIIENISLPDEVEKALDERTQAGIMEDKMGTFTQYQAAKALRDAAQNQSGGNLAGLGVGLGAGMSMGQTFSNALATENKPKQKKTETQKANKEAKITCSKCGATISAKDKFCPECGTPLNKKCPKCVTMLKAGAKFCPECGEKVE